MSTFGKGLGIAALIIAGVGVIACCVHRDVLDELSWKIG